MKNAIVITYATGATINHIDVYNTDDFERVVTELLIDTNVLIEGGAMDEVATAEWPVTRMLESWDDLVAQALACDGCTMTHHKVEVISLV